MATPETVESEETDDASAPDLSQVIEFMTTDKSNDWTEEIAVLEDIEKQLSAPRLTVADLDGTLDEADWIQSGHVLDDDDVAYIRSLILPGPSGPLTEGSDG